MSANNRGQDAYQTELRSRLNRRPIRELTPHLRGAIVLLHTVAPRVVRLVGAIQIFTAVGIGLQILLTKRALEVFTGAGGGIAALPILLGLAFVGALLSVGAAAQAHLQALLGERVVRATWQRVLSVT